MFAGTGRPAGRRPAEILMTTVTFVRIVVPSALLTWIAPIAFSGAWLGWLGPLGFAAAALAIAGLVLAVVLVAQDPLPAHLGTMLWLLCLGLLATPVLHEAGILLGMSAVLRSLILGLVEGRFTRAAGRP
jgi:hypothetical protein